MQRVILDFELRFRNPRGTSFNSIFHTTSAQVAQSVEQRTENARVGGSIPSWATTQQIF